MKVKIIVLIIMVLSVCGCGTNPFVKGDNANTTNPIGNIINVGDGKILGIDFLAPVVKTLEQVRTSVQKMVASCNKDGELTATCYAGWYEGKLAAKGNYLSARDASIKEALAKFEIITKGEEYECCKLQGIFVYDLIGEIGGAVR